MGTIGKLAFGAWTILSAPITLLARNIDGTRSQNNDLGNILNKFNHLDIDGNNFHGTNDGNLSRFMEEMGIDQTQQEEFMNLDLEDIGNHSEDGINARILEVLDDKKKLEQVETNLSEAHEMLKEKQAFDKKWEGKVNIDGDGGRARELSTKIENISKDVDELGVKYSGGSGNERILMNIEQKEQLINMFTEGMENVLAQWTNYLESFKELGSKINDVTLALQQTQSDSNLVKKDFLPFAKCMGKLSQENELKDIKKELKGFKKIKNNKTLKQNLDKLDKKLQDLDEFTKACYKNHFSSTVQESYDLIITKINSNKETIKKLKDLRETHDSLLKEKDELENPIEFMFNRGGLSDNDITNGRIDGRKIFQDFQSSSIEGCTNTNNHRGHIISVEIIKEFFLKIMKEINIDNVSEEFVTPLINFTITCSEKGGNSGVFNQLVTKCLQYSQDKSEANKTSCEDLLSSSILWNPGNILLAPNDENRLKLNGDKYPESNVEERGLLALDDKFFDLIKNIMYKMDAQSGLNTQKIKIQELKEDSSNKDLVDFANDRKAAITNVIDERYESIADFFKDWGRLCEVSNAQFLTENNFEKNIHWVDVNGKCDLDYLAEPQG